MLDRKSTRLNSSHLVISYAVFCLKKKKAQFYRIVAGFAIAATGRHRNRRSRALPSRSPSTSQPDAASRTCLGSRATPGPSPSHTSSTIALMSILGMLIGASDYSVTFNILSRINSDIYSLLLPYTSFTTDYFLHYTHTFLIYFFFF